MAILDIILLICFVPGIVSGLSKGFVKQVVEFVAILLAAWAAFKFSSTMGTWLAQYINADGVVLQILSFVVIILFIALVLNLLAGLLTKILNFIALGWFNKLLGLAFGILKVALILGLVILAFEGLNAKLELIKPEFFEGAVVYDTIKDLAQDVFPYLKSFITGTSNA